MSEKAFVKNYNGQPAIRITETARDGYVWVRIGDERIEMTLQEWSALPIHAGW
jgi:hypothetical protein